MQQELKKKKGRRLGEICRGAGLLAMLVFCSPGCMDPSFYEDPPPEDDLKLFQGWVPSGDVQDRQGSIDGGEIEMDILGDEFSTAGEDKGDGDEVSDEGEGLKESLPDGKCFCDFDLPVTSPLPQTFVWLTGDFLTPPWSMSPADGAIELVLNPEEGFWNIRILLEETQRLEYKYLVGWTDNPGPIWWNQAGDSSEGAENSLLLVVCGLAPCD